MIRAISAGDYTGKQEPQERRCSSRCSTPPTRKAITRTILLLLLMLGIDCRMVVCCLPLDMTASIVAEGCSQFSYYEPTRKQYQVTNYYTNHV